MKLSEICRLCLVKSPSTNIDELFFPIDNGLERKFSEITNDSVKFAKPRTEEELQKFPDKVCMSCVSELEHHYNYRNGLIEKQKRLNVLLQIKEEVTESRQEPFPSENLGENDHCSDQETSNTEREESLHEEEHTLEHSGPLDAEGSENETTQKDLETTSRNLDQEYEAVYGEAYEDYQPTESQSEFFDGEEDAATSNTEELDETCEVEEEIDDDELSTMIDDDDYPVEHEDYLCVVKEEDVDESDDDYVVYEEDIAMEEETHHKRKYTKQSKDSPKQFKCWIKNCGSTFSFRATMKKHMNQAHSIACDRSTCFICGDKYDNYADFLAHVKCHTRKSQCDVCKLTFINDERLLKHTTRFHKKNDDVDRNFQCHICNARFKRKEHVNSHIIYKHSDKNARKFACKDCPSTFLTRQDLKNHDKSHSQVKIKCVYCTYDCRDLKSIKRHCVKFHNTMKIYKCLCDETFELFRDLQLHKKNCSGTEVLDSATEY